MPKTKMAGEAFMRPVPDDDTPIDTHNPATFDVRAWIRGTAPVTRSCTVYGRADLMGEIEALKDELAEVQAADFDDARLSMGTPGLDIARRIEDLRAQMAASAVRFRFRGLRNGELEEIKAETQGDPNPEGFSEVDYRVMARQCLEPAGLGWEDFRDLHTSLGAYFTRTLMKTAVEAVSGGGVDVPFSSASSALIANSPKS